MGAEVSENGLQCFDEIITPDDVRISMYATLNPNDCRTVEISINDCGVVMTIPGLSLENLRRIGSFFSDAQRHLKATSKDHL